jgi:Tfp pilus assembly protein PilZ
MEVFPMNSDKPKKRRSKQKKTTGPSLQTKENVGKNDLELLKVTRDSFRRPIADPGKVEIQISGQAVTATNLSCYGVGILVPEENTFSSGDHLTEISIHCGENQILLQGQVVHITPAGSGDYLCGIQFSFAAKKDVDQLRRYIQENHADLFFEEKE